MRDNQIYAALFPVIKGGLTMRGVPNVAVIQSYQPTQQGVPSGASVFVSKIGGDVKVGHVRRDSVPDININQMEEIEQQQYRSTYQINARYIQDPRDTRQLTASDVLITVSEILQSSSTIAMLKPQGIGILRIAEIRNMASKNDQDRFEFEPSFDFDILHSNTWRIDTPILTATEFNFKRV